MILGRILVILLIPVRIVMTLGWIRMTIVIWGVTFYDSGRIIVILLILVWILVTLGPDSCDYCDLGCDLFNDFGQDSCDSADLGLDFL
jgi:hypothetical protein